MKTFEIIDNISYNLIIFLSQFTLLPDSKQRRDISSLTRILKRERVFGIYQLIAKLKEASLLIHSLYAT